MTELSLYHAVTSCRQLLRQGREPAAAARIATSSHGLGSMEEPLIRRYATVAEVALQQWRDSNPPKP